ncbi:probable LRR receptor-like serine/threonine-protein kinase At4g29180 [Syzygium oleosum]|uniref:probable LRR receptor-like serine/threonine-protein kinase At4g29180 n=1 Tax=Syzygium oleosum TaxID=219896 RepID=UPI0024B8D659|nr:probable LRR receptor-like serine/threonine-protein kinase At4g29180 [Syzygium oleosum]
MHTFLTLLSWKISSCSMTMGRSLAAFSFALLACLASALVLVVQAQKMPFFFFSLNLQGFINIDYGAPNQYTEEEINITYGTDERFIDFGENMQVSSKVIYTYNQQYSKNLRSFPNGTRNCYTLRPDRGTNITYLIMATFWYGNYDGKNQTPFDLHIGINYWAKVNSPAYFCEEIMYVSQEDDIQVCLVNTGKGVPFISALELRPLDDGIYRLGSGFLQFQWRFDIGLSSKTAIKQIK